MSITRNGRIAAGAMAAVLAGSLAACSGGGGGGGEPDEGATAEEIEAALEEGGIIDYWTWTPQAEKQIEAFEKAYPNMTVNLTDTQGAEEHNTGLQNAIAADKGIPDVAQLEYQSVPQFQLPGQLTDVTGYGLGELEDLYTPSTWGSVALGDGLWGLPQDSGPMALFYNAEVFEENDLVVPKTWDEYVEQARKLKKSDPDKVLFNDDGNGPGTVTSMIWQAGGKPFQVEGDTVTIDLADEGTTRWAETYQQLIDEELMSDITGWSDEWYQALGDGTIASMVVGAWMPGIFEDGVPDGDGAWRIAPMPTYDGTPVNAENGGSADVIPAGADDKVLAAGFLKWLNSDPESIRVFMETGGFPATVAELGSEEFLGYESEYFGGQKINEVLAAGADDVVEGWSYLPWQSYANSIFSDTVGQAYLDRTSLLDGLSEWQAENVRYGEEQGFTVDG
ncbi:multiple sugar transport system substrate-binding protein [Promicromonospora umidemergens]|uniref:Sugar ABC transporter substrate-binding protein n=1 Tax=Promicromonospora umidemergens TaxID=629679 RepID=A0ABP8X027_9MICO|nr:sugar ABC transporter substrate-binding protein [Promicromonospora umidemergens]MCP2286522.1 multiple sugar transport system substrate-binding protein [Promicromonospora umidemergens]